jgi:hypothetical protein
MPLCEKFRREFCITSETKRLGESDQVLVTIEFPCNFAVPDFTEIEVFHLKPWLPWRPFSVHSVRVPVDLRSIVQRFVSQKIKPMLTNALGTLDDLLGRLRKQLTQVAA